MGHRQEHTERPGVRGSLRLRLAVAVVSSVVAVTGLAAVLDYRREYRVHLAETVASLAEQARGLALARKRIVDPREYAEYVDGFCAQMDRLFSPGHHILVLDPNGSVLVRVRRHSGKPIERALLAADPNQQVLSVDGHSLAQVRLVEPDGETLIFAQYLDRIEQILRRQLISRAVVVGASATAIIALIFGAIQVWAIRPMRRLTRAAEAWSTRSFTVRADETGPTEVRLLAGKLNAMAAELEDHQRKRLAELELARSIQANLLPAGPPSVNGLKIAAEYFPVAHVAGDLYDVFELPDGSTAIAVLDVAGHDISAALLTGVVKMSLRYRLAETLDPATALGRVNRDLLACTAGEQFVTATVGLWQPGRRAWAYALAGHPGGILLRDGRTCLLEKGGPLLGVIPEASWCGESIDLRRGDRLLLYTDGVTESGVPDNAMGVSGLAELLRHSADVELAHLVTRIHDEALRRSGGRAEDDMTLIAIEVT